MNFTKKIALGTVVVIAAGVGGKTLFDYKAENEVFAPKEGVNYTVIDTSKAQTQLQKLGVKNNDSYEFFSYSCGHCYAMSKVLKTVEKNTGVKLTQLALNFNNLPLAQTHYTISTINGDKTEGFQRQLFKIAENGNLSFQEKNNEINALPSAYGIKLNDSKAIGKDAEEYSHLVSEAFNNLSLEYTPTIIINGKYLLKNESLQTVKQMEELISFLHKKDKPELKTQP